MGGLPRVSLPWFTLPSVSGSSLETLGPRNKLGDLPVGGEDGNITAHLFPVGPLNVRSVACWIHSLIWEHPHGYQTSQYHVFPEVTTIFLSNRFPQQEKTKGESSCHLSRQKRVGGGRGTRGREEEETKGKKVGQHEPCFLTWQSTWALQGGGDPPWRLVVYHHFTDFGGMAAQTGKRQGCGHRAMDKT